MKTINKITSRDNQKLKFAKKVRDGKIVDAVFVEGVRLAEEVIRSGLKIIECFYEDDFCEDARGKQLIEKISAQNENVSEVKKQLFQTIAETKSSQGIVLIVEKPTTNRKDFIDDFEKDQNESPLIVFLSEINNPSNLGAIFRTVEAAGAAGVIVSSNSANVFSPKAVRSAMGASFRLNVWENAGFDEVLEWAKNANLETTAADVNAKKAYTEIDWKKPRLIVFGSEAHGLSEKNRAAIEELIYIPMENGVESLNLAVSCGIILFEAKRQKNSG